MSAAARCLDVLVVDDDAATCRMLARMLRHAGHRVAERTDAVTALDDVTAGRPLDVVVTDCVMPGLLGHEVATAAVREHPTAGVVFVSGSAGGRVGELPHEVRSRFLGKPFGPDELLEAVAAVAPLPVAVPAGVTPLPSAPAVAARPPRRADATPLPLRRLSNRDWEVRHQILTLVLWVHALALPALAAGAAHPGDALRALACLVPPALVASLRAVPALPRALAVTVGLLVASELLVDLAPGLAELHAYFSIVVVLLSLYEDWSVFGAAAAVALLHQGIVGHDPWSWCVIQAAFIASVALVDALSWRLLERVNRDERRARERLSRANRVDALTGVGNRLALVEAIADRPAEAAAVLLVELDRFRVVNDLYGTAAGDRLLCDVARRIALAAGPEDVVARVGGDEFALLVPGSAEGTPAIAGRILQAMLDPFAVAGEPHHQTCSIGVTHLGPAERDADGALLRSTAAVQSAKDAGRARVEIADESLLLAARRRAEIERALTDAAPEEFHLAFQPIVDLADGSLAAVEALLRWSSPALGAVPPSDFVPVAERLGRMGEIGDLVLDMACRQIAEWERDGVAPPKVFVNIAAAQIADRSFASRLMATLGRTGVHGERIALELTETSFVEGMIPPANLTALKEAGIDLVLDDFGVGYSSLGYLARFPIATLKLDRSFIAPERLAESWVILDAVVNLSRGLRLATVAEGIESHVQLDMVRRRGFAYGQGFLFARPMAAPDLRAVLARPRPYASVVADLHGPAQRHGVAA